MEKTTPHFLKTPDEFRKWLHENHETQEFLWAGYYKVATKKPSMTWSESVDQAICYGWIDGIRKKIDEECYMIRFTPRKPRSIWSKVNLEKIQSLRKAGLMMPAGEATFLKWEKKHSKKYSYEQDKVKLDEKYIDAIKKNKSAWDFWDNLAPSYKKATTWWLMSAKREETRLRRLNILIESSANGEKIPPLRRD